MAEVAGGQNLHNLVQKIVSSFKGLSTVKANRSDLSDYSVIVARLKNENQRFDLWCRNMGAYQSGHASLEYRFRDAPKVYDYAFRLLNGLYSNVALVFEELSAKQDSSLTDSDDDPNVDKTFEDELDDSDDDDEFLDSYNAKSLPDVLAESIATTIDRLYRLSFKIRNPATRFNLSRILKFQDIDSESNTDVLTYYTQFDRSHVKELLWDLRTYKDVSRASVRDDSETSTGTGNQNEVQMENERLQHTSMTQDRFDSLDSDFLVRRLVDANNIRRRQLRYWQTHQRKLATVKIEPLPAHTVKIAPDKSKASWIPTPSLATTEATKLREQDIDLSDTRSVVSSATYALMQTEPGHEEVRVPPFPSWIEGKKEFECPYCHIVCPGSMARRSAWETHVLRDLRPYVCMYEDCHESDQLFDTFQSWNLHEIQEHDVEVRESIHGESYEPVRFKDHRKLPKSHTDNDLKKGNGRNLRECPFCLEIGVTAAHIGTHLQRVAIFALPIIQKPARADGSDEDDSHRATGVADTIFTTSVSTSDEDENSDQFPDQTSKSRVVIKGSSLSFDNLTAHESDNKQLILARYLSSDEVAGDKDLESIAEMSDPKVELHSEITLHGEMQYKSTQDKRIDRVSEDSVRDAKDQTGPLTQTEEGNPSDDHDSNEGDIPGSEGSEDEKFLQRPFYSYAAEKLDGNAQAKLVHERDRFNTKFDSVENHDQPDKGALLPEEGDRVQTPELTDDHPDWIRSQRKLAETYRLNGQEEKAISLLEQVTKTQALKGQLSDFSVINHLGSLYSDQGRLEEAQTLYQQALAEHEQKLTPNDLSTLYILNSLGKIYDRQGKYDQAEQILLQANARFEQALGPNDPYTLRAISNLASLYHREGKLDEAEQMYNRLLGAQERDFGLEHPDTLETVSALGHLYRGHGRFEEAEQLYNRALAGREKTLGREHPSTLATIQSLGGLYHEQGRLAEAEQVYERALVGREQALGPEHSSTLATVHRLGMVHLAQGRLAEAEGMLKRALVGYESYFGAEHDRTLGVARLLGRVYLDQGKQAEAAEMFKRAGPEPTEK